jgi:hypothetical protein
MIIARSDCHEKAITPVLRQSHPKIPDPNRVLSCNYQGEVPRELFKASVTGFLQGSDGPDSAKDLFEAFSDLPSNLVSRVVRGATIDGKVSVSRRAVANGRSHSCFVGHESFRILTLSCTYRRTSFPGSKQHTFGVTIIRKTNEIDL